MDITFNCPSCKQELVVDDSGIGSQVECPGCGNTVVIPDVTHAPHIINAMASSAAAKEEKHFTVPTHDAPSEVLIKKANVPLEVAAKITDKKLRVKTIRRTDCVEVGRDLFDDKVTDFLAKVGEENIVNINTIVYTHLDLGTRQLMTDFGVLITYKG